jgi:hypothetical protein
MSISTGQDREGPRKRQGGVSTFAEADAKLGEDPGDFDDDHGGG